MFFDLIEAYEKKSSRKIKKIKQARSNSSLVKEQKVKKKRFLKGVGNKEEIKYKLIQAGEPFSNLGINEENWIVFKLAISIGAMLMSKISYSWSFSISYGCLGFFLLEWFVKRKIEKRHQEFAKELDVLVSTTVECLNMGLNLNDIFIYICERIDTRNPLYLELLRVKTNIEMNSIGIKFEHIVHEFQRRIGMEEIDNYCLALSQYEVAGKAKRMLSKQLDLLRTTKNQRKKRETQIRANLTSLSVAMIVISIMLTIIVPMIILALESPIFN